MKKIIHGIGRAVLKDFTNPKKIIDYTDLQDLSFESSYSKEDITGGNKVVPIASFKKDTAVKVSATNATFHPEIIEYMDGASQATAAAQLPELKEVMIPAPVGEATDCVITLKNTPVAKSVIINGYEEADTLAAGKFEVDVTTKSVSFIAEDAGKQVVIYYEYMSSKDTVNYSVSQDSMSKPFEFDYIFDIYDENTQVTHNCVIKVYKMQTTSGFKIDPKHQSPVAPVFEAEAKDPMRTDGHMWDFFMDSVKQA